MNNIIKEVAINSKNVSKYTSNHCFILQVRSFCCSTLQYGKNPSKELSKKYSNTLFLPKTTFPQRVEGKKRAQRDKDLFQQCEFDKLYQWQREHRKGDEFVLHDGPPYANGSPHIGHAVNKILKDITVRYQCSQGRKVHYVPGWDCHGLPIEMKAVKGPKEKKLLPGKIREIASNFAKKTVESQMSEFRRWGLLADWDNRYRTLDPCYVKNQLEQFLQLFEGGFIFRDYMPVYWSPSSRTALAEAELEYNPHHESRAIYLRLQLKTLSPKLNQLVTSEKKVCCIIWTTTPWSIVANKAVCYHPSISYSLVSSNTGHLYLVSSELINSPGIQSSIPGLKEVSRLTGSDIEGCTYHRPLSDDIGPLLPGSHVTSTSGTGLVHTAPAHGQDDYKIGLEYKLSLDCQVGEDGKYMDSIEVKDVAGLEVLGEGGDKVVELLGDDVLYQEMVTHSYPYDWRTKQPVILRGSKQWFIDTNKLKTKAEEVVRNIQIQPQSAVNGFMGVIENRPYWCISRQRVWGTFIPVIYSKESRSPIVNQELIKKYQELVEQHGTGFWWEMSTEDILENTSMNPEEYYREGLDIMDIWLDSGLSWACALNTDQRPADLYLEGLDQFSGWFYSSLLTSLALTGKAPYERLFVHGFTLDEDGNKMSKSLGNVVSPSDVLDKKHLGVDVLRWWVASHASSSASVHVGDKILQASKLEVDRMRNVIRFLLGQLTDATKNDDVELFLLDRAILLKLDTHMESCRQYYHNMEYNKVCLSTLSFISLISSSYIHLVKDRLYCDGGTSSGRQSAVTTILNLARGLGASLGPIMPLLTEEMSLSCTVLGSPLRRGWVKPTEKCNQGLVDLIQTLDLYREEGNKNGKLDKGGECHAIVTLKTEFKDVVIGLTDPEREVGEVLGVASVEMLWGDEGCMEVVKSSGDKCLRCRRNLAPIGSELCYRCSKVILSN